MVHASDMAPLEGRLGYRFRDRALLEQALTHPSAGGRDNQRLEFLGDALLDLSTAELIHRERPDLDEGAMTKLQVLLVCTEALAAWAKDLGLELRTGGGKRGKAAMGPKPLADAMEALLAAVYLDAGAAVGRGLLEITRLVEARHLAEVKAADTARWAGRDPKTSLQELAARRGLPAPAYALLGQSGPGHAPRFSVQASVGAEQSRAEGGSRKGAEAEAARLLLQRLEAAGA